MSIPQPCTFWRAGARFRPSFKKSVDAAPVPAGLCVCEKRSRVLRATKGLPAAAPRLNRLPRADRAENPQGFVFQWLAAIPRPLALPARIAVARNAPEPQLVSASDLAVRIPGGRSGFSRRPRRMKKAAAFRPPPCTHVYYTHSSRVPPRREDGGGFNRKSGIGNPCP